MKGIALFSLSAAALIALLFLLLGLVFPGEGARAALLVSAVTGLVVQIVLFSVVKLAASENVMVAWGVGTLVRFFFLIGYAFLIAKQSQLELGPALIGLATFFFACTLLEPYFLRK